MPANLSNLQIQYPETMLLVFLPRETNRTKYTFSLILGKLLGIDYQITTDADVYRTRVGPKFSYGRVAPDDSLHFGADNLLFQRGIDSLETGFGHHEGLPVLFRSSNQKSALPFDLFAAAFYMVSRYEEYLPYRRDEFGRFSARESLAFKKGFLHRPVVNLWAMLLRDELLRRWPSLKMKLPVYRCEPTVDIDSAFSYKHKGFLRSVGGFARNLRQLDFQQAVVRAKVLAGTMPDPFDVFEQFHQLHQRLGLEAVYFVLFADYGRLDKNIPVQNYPFRMLVKSLADYARVGIHPSYASNSGFNTLRREVTRLNQLLNSEITLSRQHFLKLDLPVTYRNLINLNIAHDYTMGFAADAGFRAGICVPHPFYDLDLDTVTPLTIHPFTVMDGTMKDYLNLDNQQAVEFACRLADEVKAVGGVFSTLWHNETHSETGRWTGWSEVYRQILEHASS